MEFQKIRGPRNTKIAVRFRACVSGLKGMIGMKLNPLEDPFNYTNCFADGEHAGID